MIEVALFKVGGSIIDNSANLKCVLSQINHLYEKKIIKKVLLISGGGSFANYVRDLDKQVSLGNDLAHWMAILAMDYNSLTINKFLPSSIITDDLEYFKNQETGIYVFLAFKYLYETDPLPHSWNVTSDSIALHLTYTMNMKECFLIKSVEGIYDQDDSNKPLREISVAEYQRKHVQIDIALGNDLKSADLLDSYAPNIIKTHQITCVILGGLSGSQSIFAYFNENGHDFDKIFTKIMPHSLRKG
jgi:aspartokinase-like uncharacterized kinase